MRRRNCQLFRKWKLAARTSSAASAARTHWLSAWKVGLVSQQFEGGESRPRPLPPATVARLADYERALSVLGRGKSATSSEQLAAAAGVSPSTLRKDLSYLGTYGVRGVGYDVRLLLAEVQRTLGAHRMHRVALVGVGNLGAALANYPGFVSRGLVVGALFDVDPHRVGQRIGGVLVDHVDDIAEVCGREDITIGVIATPEGAAQRAADALVDAGVGSILAFTPGVIQVPPDVELRKVDLAVELQVLAFHASRRTATADNALLGAPADSADTADIADIADTADTADAADSTGTPAVLETAGSGTAPSEDPVQSVGPRQPVQPRQPRQPRQSRQPRQPAPPVQSGTSGSSSTTRSTEAAPAWPVVDVRRTVSTALSRSAG